MRRHDGSDFYRGTTEQDEQGDDILSLVKIMQGHYQKQKETLEKQENKDPAPGRENKGTGIPERNALGPPYPCPEETLWRIQ